MLHPLRAQRFFDSGLCQPPYLGSVSASVSSTEVCDPPTVEAINHQSYLTGNQSRLPLDRMFQLSGRLNIHPESSGLGVVQTGCFSTSSSDRAQRHSSLSCHWSPSPSFPRKSGFVLCPQVRKALMTCDSDLAVTFLLDGSSRVTSSSFLWQNPPPVLTPPRQPLDVFCVE